MSASTPEEDRDELLLVTFLRLLLRRWWLVAIVWLAVFAGAIWYALNAPRVYRAEALVAPAAQERPGGGGLERFASQFGGLAALAGLGAGGATVDKDVALATLRSRRFQEQFIVDHDLLRRFYADRWNERTKSFEPSWTGAVPSMDDALKHFNQRVFEVSEDRRSGLIKIRIDWGDREEGARWANELVDRVNRATRDDALREAERSLKFLNAELPKTAEVEVRRSIFEMMETQINRVMLANVRQDFAFRVIDPAVAVSERHYVKPRKRVVAMLGFAGGAVLGVGLVLLLELLGALRGRRRGTN